MLERIRAMLSRVFKPCEKNNHEPAEAKIQKAQSELRVRAREQSRAAQELNLVVRKLLERNHGVEHHD